MAKPGAELLLLDSSIRLWVVLPIVLISFSVGLIRHYLSRLLQGERAMRLEQLSDSQILGRSRSLREHGKYLPRQSFIMRKHFFNNAETGFFKKTKRKVTPKSPMTDPTLLTDMMKGNLTNVLPMILIGGWINWAFSGFVTAKVPFPLTLRFKPMLQRGIELVSLDASCCGSVAYSPGPVGRCCHVNATRYQQGLQEWEALETVDYHWALEGVEDELMATDLNLEEFYIREQRLPMF
ncbi:ER membrane protein complex subunit 3-like isoform X3 [Scyliorhinus torazame]|uniref:ER membrane protein complex subunit 3-like isoform X3 n=1 Tax=Scyliorhinus torazame TaxID=75743 RepID=UPI003B5A6581